MNKKIITIAIKVIVITIFLILSIYVGYLHFIKSQPIVDEITVDEVASPKEEPEEIKTLNIIDVDSDERSIAIMIDNISAALPHVGLQDAYIIYEIIVEGGQTRLLALYKDKTTEVIGPVRSTRHYYIDYALENDAVFVHFGHSPKALSDINQLKINNIDGFFFENPFWRNKKIKAPHNVFTSMEKLREGIKIKNYNTKLLEPILLNYVIDEFDLLERENNIPANNIKIHYSSSHYIDYEYDEENKVYKRFMKGTPHIDGITEEQYYFKNIIIYNIKNVSLNAGEGRQELLNIGEGDGYYITNGYAIPIKWLKESRTSQTKYLDIDGNEMEINDGNTFIHLQPVNQTLVIE